MSHSTRRLDSARERWSRLQEALTRWHFDEIDFVQLREKDLDAGDLFWLCTQAVEHLHRLASGSSQPRPRLLLNGRADVAAAAGVDGVHLTSAPGALHPAQVRQVFAAAGCPPALVSVSTHTLEEVRRAKEQRADLVLFGPVFEKCVQGEAVAEGVGLEQLREACLAAASTRVLALGGMAVGNTAACLEAGAAGIAGIRLFGG